MNISYDWYYLFNLQTFIDAAIVSRSLVVNLPLVGLKTILITSGDTYCITVDGVILSIGLNNKNPFEFDSHAVYFDADKGVWLGLLHAD